MKRETLLISILAIVAMGGFAVAAEGDIADGELGMTIDATWVSKYIWRGVDLTGDRPAFQPSVNFDLYGTGFSAYVWASYATTSGAVNANEYNYAIQYGNSINQGEATELAYTAGYIYYDFIDEPTSQADAQEVNLTLAMPKICGGIIPSYTIIKMWGTKSSSNASPISGWIHVLGLDYALPVGDMFGNNIEQVVDLSVDATYNGSAGVAGAAGEAVDHDWSHILFGASTGIDLSGAGTLRPGIFYQISMDDSVNNENELWGGISYSYKF